MLSNAIVAAREQFGLGRNSELRIGALSMCGNSVRRHSIAQANPPGRNANGDRSANFGFSTCQPERSIKKGLVNGTTHLFDPGRRIAQLQRDFTGTHDQVMLGDQPTERVTHIGANRYLSIAKTSLTCTSVKIEIVRASGRLDRNGDLFAYSCNPIVQSVVGRVIDVPGMKMAHERATVSAHRSMGCQNGRILAMTITYVLRRAISRDSAQLRVHRSRK